MYTKTAWVNDTTPAINETNLNNIENGIFDNNITDTIATLRALLEAPERIYATGYHIAGDNAFGSHFYKWNNTSTDSDNNGTIIKLTSIVTGRYELQYSGAVNIKWFGAEKGATSNITPIRNTVTYAATVNEQVFSKNILNSNSKRVSEVARKLQDNEAVTIVCLGDSITEGVGVLTAENYPSVLKDIIDEHYRNTTLTIINSGVGGDTVDMIIDRFVTDVSAHNPDLVIFMGGMNDVRIRTEQQFSDDLNTLYSLCGIEDYALIVGDITPRWKVSNEGYEQIQYFRKIGSNVAKMYNIPLVPTYDMMYALTQGEMPYDTVDISYDGTHYTIEGYRHLAGAFFCASGLSNISAIKKEYGVIKSTDPLISSAVATDYVFSSDDAVDIDRADFTQSTVNSQIVLRFWYSGEKKTILSAALAHRFYKTGTVTHAERISLRNRTRHPSVGSFKTFNLGVETAGNTKAIYGLDTSICEIINGYNEIGINADSVVGNKFTVDGFKILPVEFQKFPTETYKPDTIQSYYELLAPDYRSIFTKQGIDETILATKSRTIGVIHTPTISLLTPKAWGFYLQIDTGITKIHFGTRHEVGTEFEAAYTLELDDDGLGVVDARLYVNFRDATSQILTTVLDIGAGLPNTVGSGNMTRILFNNKLTDDFSTIQVAQGLNKVIGTIPCHLPTSEVIIENTTASSANVSALYGFTYDYYADGAGGGAALSGEEFIDPLNSRKVVTVAGVYKFIAYT